MVADEYIPVTEETRKQLQELKESGETYDELLRELTQHRRREELQRRFRQLETLDADRLTPLESL
jgi:predicted CopG family antitoxin